MGQKASLPKHLVPFVRIHLQLLEQVQKHPELLDPSRYFKKFNMIKL